MEIKSLDGKNIISVLRTKEMPSEFTWQVQGQLWITGKDKCIFVAYHPKLPKAVLEVGRDEKAIQELEQKLIKVVEETKTILKEVQCTNIC